jgi:polycystin 1L2
LGSLACIRVWHDNSGKGAAKASWYLKHIIVNDLTTRIRFYFICEQWLAVEKEDGMVERVINTAGHQEKNELMYLFKKKSQAKLSDSHLWISVFTRPVQSAFSRLDRLTCVFVLLVISMLIDIIYYSLVTLTDPNAVKLGPFIFTLEQVHFF